MNHVRAIDLTVNSQPASRGGVVAESGQALMLQLLRGQRNTSDPELMMLAAAEAIGRFLQVDRVGFLEVTRRLTKKAA